ncbi:hypothetical protein B0H14DRAFT_3450278 [Mycena olivaceomarginata]|nr:hypothetical protein B0H14DRAFT_3450278 [Mycena olivaceomarginata]
MPAAYATVATVSSTRMRNGIPPKKTAPLTTEQRKEKRDARQDKQARIDARVRKFFDDTNALANDMAAEFDMKPRYFLDIFFQGGAHLINHQDEINSYNAFKALKSAEVREEGLVKNAPQLHRDYYDEYTQLTTAEKTALVDKFKPIREQNYALHRDTPRAKIQDVANIVRNMKMLLYALKQRVGVEGLFCIVRNNVEFQIEPEWYFTCDAIEQYMEVATRKKWVTGEVGMKLEAFAIAGCDPANMLRTSKQKADWMKGEIRVLLKKSLADVSKVPDARMAYTWPEEDVVQRYGVVLEGWTAGKFVDPSDLSTSLTVLRTLLDALKSGECAFRKLGPVEAANRQKKWEEDVAAGRVVAKHRQPRCDAGIPRKRVRDEERDKERDEEDENDENEPSRAGGSASEAPRPPPKKRARTAVRDSPTAAVKSRTKAATTAGAKKTAPKKKRGPPKKAAPAPEPRDDATTRGAVERLKAVSRSRVVSRAIINSDDERDDDPDADAEGTSIRLPPPPLLSLGRSDT